jgi:hypothetical protein
MANEGLDRSLAEYARDSGSPKYVVDHLTAVADMEDAVHLESQEEASEHLTLVSSTLATMLGTMKEPGSRGTHSATCWKRHPGCLLRTIQELVDDGTEPALTEDQA